MNQSEKEFVKDMSHGFGMNYSLNDEAQIMKHIITMGYDINMVSKYADDICVSNHKNIEFLKHQLDRTQWSNDKLIQMKSKINNPTSLGNVAYLALNSPAPYNQLATEIYNMIVITLYNDGRTPEKRYEKYLLDNPPIRIGNVLDESIMDKYPYVVYTPIIVFCVALIAIKLFYTDN